MLKYLSFLLFSFIAFNSQAQTTSTYKLGVLNNVISNEDILKPTLCVAGTNDVCDTGLTVKDNIWHGTVQYCNNLQNGLCIDPRSYYYSTLSKEKARDKVAASYKLLIEQDKNNPRPVSSYTVTNCNEPTNLDSYKCTGNYVTASGNVTIPIEIPQLAAVGCAAPGVYIEGLGCTDPNVQRYPESDYCIPCATGEAAKYFPPTELYTQKRGDPIDVAKKSVVETKIDISFPIPFIRKYDSTQTSYSILGLGWKHNFDKKLRIVTKNINNVDIPVALGVIEDNNEEFIFTRTDGFNPFVNINNDQKGSSIVIDSSGTFPQYIFTSPNGNKEVYNNNGLLTKITLANGIVYSLSYAGANSDVLTTITNNYGQSIGFSYNANGFLETVVPVGGAVTKYNYSNNQLSSVLLNNVPVESYTYNNMLLLSEIKDSTNTTVAMFSYDNLHQAIQNAKIVDNRKIEQHDFSYTGQYYKETQPNGNVVNYEMDNTLSKTKIKNFNEGNYDHAYQISYDSNGNLSGYSGVGGNFSYNYDSDNLLSSVYTPNGQTITTTWDNSTRKLTALSEPTSNGTRNTTYAYDQYRNIITKTVTGANETRVWKYTYDIGNKPLTVINPDGTTLTYTYYDNSAPLNMRGLLKTVTNKLGQKTTINSYDVRGNPTSITGVNGVTKTMSYDVRGNLLTEQTGNAINAYTYNNDNDLLTISLANGYQMTMTYDSAHRLASIVDNRGGSKTFVLDDTTGSSTNESIYQNNSLVSQLNKSLDNFGRATKTWADNQSNGFDYTYLADDSIGTMTDGNYFQHRRNLNDKWQLQSSLDPAEEGNYIYDNDGLPTTIHGNFNNYNITYNDFKEPATVNSYDTGNHTYSYDLTNKTFTHVDATNTLHVTKYDDAGRIIKNFHTDTSEVIRYNNTNNTITFIQNDNARHEYLYDSLARVTQQTSYIFDKSFVVKYTYDDAGQLKTMTYPSGLVVNYNYTNGLLTSMTTSGVASANILSNVQYMSLKSLPTSWNLNGSIVAVGYDGDGYLASFTDGANSQTFTTDKVGNITNITDGSNNISVTYNENYQVAQTNINGTVTNYGYTSNHNLQSKNDIGFVYKAQSNTLSGISNNVTNAFVNIASSDRGEILNDAENTYSYDGKGNLSTSNNAQSSTSYYYDALNQRVDKYVDGVDTYFVYSNGQLIGEYDANGNTISEHVYFGLRPIALYKNNKVYTVHTDYLSTPREIKDGTATVWKWENKDVFGGNSPIVETVEYNLRFAGQYFDKENKLHYNLNRTYNPQLGRYMQSDPKGLAAGFNTYSYVRMNPVNAIDPLGLDGISASKDPLISNMIKNPNTVPEGYLGIGLHGTWGGFYNNLTLDKKGGFQLQKDSPLYEMLDKNNSMVKKLNFDEDGNVGLDGRDLAKILKSIKGIDYSKYKGIYLYACNSGISISPLTNNLNAQDFANEMQMDTYAFPAYLIMTSYQDTAFISGYFNRGPQQYLPFGTTNNINATKIRTLFKPTR